MSSDTFYLIRRHNNKYVVTMEFDSDHEVHPIQQNADGSYRGGVVRAFDRWEDANEYAQSEYSEYGVSDWSGFDPLADLKPELYSWIEKAEKLRVEKERLEEMLFPQFRPLEPTTVLRLTNKEITFLLAALEQMIAQNPGSFSDMLPAMELGRGLSEARAAQAKAHRETI